MSTCNFYYENILIAIEDDGVEDFMDYQKADLQNELQDAMPSGSIVDEYEKDALRSYGGCVIFRVKVYSGAGYEYRIVEVVYRGGYYAGMNIDYKVVEGDDLWRIEDEKIGTKGLDKKVASICKKIERICKTYGTELKVVARFSNGETMYEKVK